MSWWSRSACVPWPAPTPHPANTGSLQAQQAARNTATPPLDLAAAPEWLALRAVILAALAPFPDARRTVVAAIGAD